MEADALKLSEQSLADEKAEEERELARVAEARKNSADDYQTVLARRAEYAVRRDSATGRNQSADSIERIGIGSAAAERRPETPRVAQPQQQSGGWPRTISYACAFASTCKYVSQVHPPGRCQLHSCQCCLDRRSDWACVLGQVTIVDPTKHTYVTCAGCNRLWKVSRGSPSLGHTSAVCLLARI